MTSETVATAEAVSTTIVVTTRDRFSMSMEALDSLVAHADQDFELLYIDAGSPRAVSREIGKACLANGFKHMRFERFLSPNEARNIGQKAATTPYVVFLENDVIVAKDWLKALIQCADETGADVVAPLTCQKLPVHSEIHHAGGTIVADVKTFLSQDHKDRRIQESQGFQRMKVVDVTLERSETQCCEFHCVLVRKDTFARLGDLDEGLTTKEHLDFCLTVWSKGGRVVLEPRSVVTVLLPSRARPVRLSDLAYYTLRWSPVWQERSFQRFQTKWDLHNDPYFEGRTGLLHWRHEEGILQPMARMIPFVRTSYRLRALTVAALRPLLSAWSRRLAARYDLLKLRARKAAVML